ncbi:MAG: hypothetical protein R6X13_06640, partial [bacterium]
DVGATAIIAPLGTLDSGVVVTPQAIVRNFGTRDENFPVTLSIGSGYSQTVQLTLGVGLIDTVSFPAWTAAPLGQLAMTCYTALEPDENRANDTATTTVTVELAADVGVEAILAPVGEVRLREGIRQTTAVPRDRVRNFGQQAAANFEVRLRIDSVEVGADTTMLGTAFEQTLTVTQSLAPGEALDLDFDEAELWLGRYVVACSTAYAPDRRPGNDRAEAPFRVAASAVADRDGRFSAVIYTRAGERVRAIEQDVSAGDPLLAYWDGLNNRGRRVAPGIYVLMLRFDPDDGAAEHQTAKLLVTTDFAGMVLTWR